MFLRAIDLFSGAGGTAVGLKRAGFTEIFGVDIERQPEYPYTFIQSDVFDLDIDFIKDCDLIWASPPCQEYSISTTRAKKDYGKTYPDLVGKTKALLLKTDKPFVIENVVGAPIRTDLWLCGCMFKLKVFRRRHFEIHGFHARQPDHKKHYGKIGDGDFFRVLSGGAWLNKTHVKGSLEEWQKAMGINWISDVKMLAEAIPPAYSEYIGLEFFKGVKDVTLSDNLW